MALPRLAAISEGQPMNRVSEHPAGSREWWRDWSAYWMRDAQGAAKLSKEMRGAGWLDLADMWRRIAAESLRRSLGDYKRSLTAHDASEWRP